jgi:hypothetical protein
MVDGKFTDPAVSLEASLAESELATRDSGLAEET